MKAYKKLVIVQVGEIPQGLPKFSVPKSFGYAKDLIPTALLITGVAILVREICRPLYFKSFSIVL